MINKLIITLIANFVFAGNQLTIDEIYHKLKIDKKTIAHSIVPEEKNIVSIGKNILGKEIFLSKKCAKAWRKMQEVCNY